MQVRKEEKMHGIKIYIKLIYKLRQNQLISIEEISYQVINKLINNLINIVCLTFKHNSDKR